MILQLDPDDDEREQKETDDLVNKTTDDLAKALNAHLHQMVPQGAGNMPPEQVAAAMMQNSAPPQRVQDILAQALREGVDLGVSVAVRQFEQISFGFDWTLPNIAARDWADQYTGQLIRGIADTNRRIVQQATSRWITNGEPLTALIRALEPHFGRQRADLIASTEVTRAYFEANKEAYKATGLVEEMEWRTSMDERRCPVCREMHGKRTKINGDWGGLSIPAHPRCRCWIAPVVAKLTKPKPAAMLENGFPADLQRLERVQSMGRRAELVRDPATGRLYVRKAGNGLTEEFAADKAYRAMGVNAPKSHLYDTPEGPVKLSEYIEGRSLTDLQANDAPAYEKALAALKKDFMADAMLGNQNVIGGNIIVGQDGRVWRTGNSGAFGLGWDQYPTEIWTMRKANPVNAAVYQNLDYIAITEQMGALGKSRKAVLDILPSSLQDIMVRRYDAIADLEKIAKVFLNDNWNVNYIDDFSRHSIGLRKAGIVDMFPKELTKLPYSTRVVDENGIPWDNLRGYKYDTIIGKVSQYISQNGGDHGIIKNWASAQAGYSWSDTPQAAKYFLANQRTVPLTNYYWHYGADASKQKYEMVIAQTGEQVYRETWTAWHAFVYEFVRNVKFPNNLLSQGVVKLMRTEQRYVMQQYNMVPGQVGQMLRGPAESTSIFKKVEVNGDQLTRQRVPHHRIFGTYFFDRYPGGNLPMFMSDGENEFIAMMEGLEVKYER